jgi:hypothetical protein
MILPVSAESVARSSRSAVSPNRRIGLAAGGGRLAVPLRSYAKGRSCVAGSGTNPSG